MGWVTVAQGTSLSDLSAVVEDMELPSGTRVKVVMDLELPVAWAFDVAGAEHIFRPFVPDGLHLIDVYGEGSKGIVEMEANSPALFVVVAFLKAHWLALSIAGFALAFLVSLIIISIKVPAIAQIPIWLLVGAAGGILGLVYLSSRKGGAT